MSTIDLLFILAISIICIISCSHILKYKLYAGNPIHKMNNSIYNIISKYYMVFVIFIFAAAVFVRIYKFGVMPYGFNQDEAMAALEGLTLSKYGTDHYGVSFPVYFEAWTGYGQMNVLLSYILIPFFKIFGVSIFTARLPLLVFSLISIYVLYRFSYRIFGKFAALAILFFIAINPWHIMISRWALEANLFPHFVLYALYLLYLGITKHKIYLYLSMILFGMSMYSYGISYYAVPVLLIILCIYLLYTKVLKVRHILISSVIYILISFPIFLMMAVNYFEWESINISFMTISYFETGQRMNDILFFSENMYMQFIHNLASTMGVLVQYPDGCPWNSIPSVGTVYFCAIPLFITGFVLMIKKFFNNKNTKEKVGIFIIIAFFITAFISGIITNYVNINRINLIFIPLIIFAGFAIYTICKRFNFLVIPIVLMFSFLFVNFSNEYFNGDHADYLGHCFYYGYSDALVHVKDLNYDKIYITADTMGDSPFVSEIIALFSLEVDNKYYLGEVELSDPDGNVFLPYHERYIYRVSYYDIAPDDIGTIYIINEYEKYLFDGLEEYFEFESFGGYCAVIHKEFI